MTLIPTETLDKWRKNARRRAMEKLFDLLELRELLSEARAEGDVVIMQMYREASEAMGKSIDSVRKDIAAIGEYSEAMLVEWIQAGLPFEALREMNTLARCGDGENGLLNASPAEVIQQVVDNGDGIGKIPTVEAIVSFALSHRPAAAIEYQINRRVSGFLKIFRLPEERETELRRELWQVFTKYMN